MNLQNDNLYKRVEGMLYSYPKVKVEIENIKLDIEELNDIIGIRGASDNQIKPTTATNQFNSNVENEVIDRDEKLPIQLENLKMKLRSRERYIRKVDNAIALLNTDDLNFIKLRYFDKIRVSNLAERYAVEPITIYKRKDAIVKSLIGTL